MNYDYRDRHMEQPQLFCIIPASQGLSWVTVNLTGRTMDEVVLHPQGGLEILGDIKFTPIKRVGYSNLPGIRWDNTRPHTREWYEYGFAENWVNSGEHLSTGRPIGSICSCGYQDCDVLGLKTTPSRALTLESVEWKDLAAARLARFQKHETNRARSREYQRERKKRLRREEGGA